MELNKRMTSNYNDILHRWHSFKSLYVCVLGEGPWSQGIRCQVSSKGSRHSVASSLGTGKMTAEHRCPLFLPGHRTHISQLLYFFVLSLERGKQPGLYGGTEHSAKPGGQL